MDHTHPDISMSTSAALRELETLTNPEIDRVAAIPNIVLTVLEVAKSVATLEREVARLKERNTLLRLQLHNSHLGRTETLLIPAVVPHGLRGVMPRNLNDLNVFNAEQCDAALRALGVEIDGKASAYAKRGIIAEQLGVRLP
ncbi:hypothetical protein TWF225_002884 [Orbilia oligospora]|uniref:Uncharacterized protein n=2 Tax=Orbilia oligospora TaxID=2813651 RepID=A0A6G1MD98_ORBOL|nr:hypothetical protein TWF225_002884 [Orbilia oligospora]KAF3196527.1 hypothetical protein TWF679_004943 [Orbilia oligospora]KAF3200340.1 hypothetical protein TWF106_003394 [Orbilia oligospora]KAF3230698.1 hypothetical protein TWF191_009607 [Orbilia oligospora]KAF3254081.1 hypothetical protein TWF192_003593 [Orbilia oligospora]